MRQVQNGYFLLSAQSDFLAANESRVCIYRDIAASYCQQRLCCDRYRWGSESTPLRCSTKETAPSAANITVAEYEAVLSTMRQVQNGYLLLTAQSDFLAANESRVCIYRDIAASYCQQRLCCDRYRWGSESTPLRCSTKETAPSAANITVAEYEAVLSTMRQVQNGYLLLTAQSDFLAANESRVCIYRDIAASYCQQRLCCDRYRWGSESTPLRCSTKETAPSAANITVAEYEAVLSTMRQVQNGYLLLSAQSGPFWLRTSPVSASIAILLHLTASSVCAATGIDGAVKALHCAAVQRKPHHRQPISLSLNTKRCCRQCGKFKTVISCCRRSQGLSGCKRVPCLHLSRYCCILLPAAFVLRPVSMGQ